ncbi:hypothetical protein DRQ20_07255 [bacterium]|nr:MAG: hypothetical protein DRQ20_07255 [bacterium]
MGMLRKMTILFLITGFSLRADWVVGDFPGRADLQGAWLNPVTNKIYLRDLVIIDGETGDTLGMIPGTDTPDFIALNPVTGKIYVAYKDIDTVKVIDAEKDSVIKSI